MHKTVVHIGHEFVISQLKGVSFRLALYLLSYLAVKNLLDCAKVLFAFYITGSGGNRAEEAGESLVGRSAITDKVPSKDMKPVVERKTA
jgi:hypothetical protein